MTDPIPENLGMGTVHHLDAHRTGRTTPINLTKPTINNTVPDPVPLQGVIVATGTAPTPDRAAVRRARIRARHALRLARTAVTHQHTRTAGRLIVRHSMYTLAGAGIVAKRTWEGRTTARYERMMRAAEATGQHDAALEWEERTRAFRAARHQRRMDLITAPQRIVKSAAIGTVGTAGGLLGLGIALAVAEHSAREIVIPLMTTVDLIRWVVFVLTVVWGPLVAVGPWLGVVGLWAVGRHRQAAPQWALPTHQRNGDDGAPITPSIVVTALRDLGIAPLRKAIQQMGDAGAGMLSPIVLAGCGVEVDILLPSGCSTEEVLGRRRRLAENLGRHEHEVHLSVAPAARTVRAWIADSGALDEPIGPSPLVLDPATSADYTKGRAPWGVDLRGDTALVSLHQRHMLITGLSNQGKTASLRALALWLAHDPAVEYRIADLKGIGDWRMFTGIATMLIEGPTDDHVMEATEMVEGGVDEMNRRLLAAKGGAFPPLVFIVDEAQVAYGSGAVGDDKRPYGGSKATSRYFQAVKKIHDQGRAVNVTIWEGTQDPTNENLPKRSREGNHIRASLVLGTESQARMALGDNAIDAGAAPHKLRQGLDKGVVVVAGDGIKLAPGQPAITIRTHYINEAEAKTLAERIKDRRDGVTTRHTIDHTQPVDHLTDIATVLGNQDKMRSTEVLSGLMALNPTEYRGWTFGDLTAVLEAVGAEPRKVQGIMTVRRTRVLDGIDERTTNTQNGDAS